MANTLPADESVCSPARAALKSLSSPSCAGFVIFEGIAVLERKGIAGLLCLTSLSVLSKLKSHKSHTDEISCVYDREDQGKASDRMSWPYFSDTEYLRAGVRGTLLLYP